MFQLDLNMKQNGYLEGTDSFLLIFSNTMNLNARTST